MDDLISRQAAIDVLRVAYWDDNIQSAKDDPCIVDAMTDWAIRQVKALPAAQPERMRGRWVTNSTLINCSVCKHSAWSRTTFENTVRSFNFCPNCGAEMDGGEQDE